MDNLKRKAIYWRQLEQELIADKGNKDKQRREYHAKQQMRDAIDAVVKQEEKTPHN